MTQLPQRIVFEPTSDGTYRLVPDDDVAGHMSFSGRIVWEAANEREGEDLYRLIWEDDEEAPAHE